MTGNAPRAILIAGPTASGKTALAIDLARALGGEVIDADAMQVYDRLAILTARPTEDEMGDIPHHLFGHVPPSESYTVARYLNDAARVIGDVMARGRLPVLVGGTGLYFSALTKGLSPVPPVDDAVRAHWRARAEAIAAPELHAELGARDPAMAERLRPSDRQRVTRALEVIESTGRSLLDWQAIPGDPLLPAGAFEGIVLAPDRAWLHGRIEARFGKMVAEGGLEEARRFAALGLDPALPAMKAIGVPEMMAAASGAMTLDEAIAAAVTATRRYAKRQETWFRNQFTDWSRIDPSSGQTDLFMASRTVLML
ncbi:tRNA dimethylallyltransferase [Hartmannibacter diazotrophicus]|uniref:tRNA dimethylallyltransferase n=1 Tax=Hartmannibacter diazotrophicus TaxID=1482074 RepID=A0A2C9D8A0_9HYPH|nr:tRNA (adenosine(37)-N6)-dimethylallyltransferase MiaA [Hartmannibacter diazotrophicus]SON56409.1 tRNA dimethylallyltransferase [Hartmannibacter diazotrophicus]